MSISVTELRIKNFRSIESISITLGATNVLIGQNNTGKSNILRAVNIALGGTLDISEADIHLGLNEVLDKNKTAIIDILIQPEDGEFSNYWMSVFTESWISASDEGSFVGIRAEIKYNVFKDSYELEKKCIRQWKGSIEDSDIDLRKPLYNEEMRSVLQAFYMDTNRDIVQDLRNRKSYFGRITSNHNVPQEVVIEIEKRLSETNTLIIRNIPTLGEIKNRITSIGPTIGSSNCQIEIEPLARRISDLNKGMDIIMKDGNASMHSISQHGSGTRSWISFLTFSAFVETQSKRTKEEDSEFEQYFMLAMEEPEAHLHPQAQRQLLSQIFSFTGQKIISTHSPSILSQSNGANIIHVSKKDGKTIAQQYKRNESKKEESYETFYEVLTTRSEVFFASAVILCEGLTEELALPVYFTKKFGYPPFALGVSIIGTGGQKYLPYLRLLKDFEIPWYIFSDGEKQTIKVIKSAIEKVYNSDYTKCKNIIIIDNGKNYETYLLEEGYSKQMIEAINLAESDESYFEDYIARMHGQKGKKDKIRNYNDEEGRMRALIDLCTENKVKYAIPVAEKIIHSSNEPQRVPLKIEELFTHLSKTLGLSELEFEEQDQ